MRGNVVGRNDVRGSGAEMFVYNRRTISFKDAVMGGLSILGTGFESRRYSKE